MLVEVSSFVAMLVRGGQYRGETMVGVELLPGM
jgi:hypothetical protein